MIKHLIFIACLMAFSAGCKKESSNPTSGEITLSSQKFGSQTFYVFGFSVATGSLVQFSLGSVTQIPDWVLEEILDISGNPVGANITTNPQNSLAFSLNGTFPTNEAALAAFSAYRDVAMPSPTDKISDIKPYQLYTYKDRSGKYTKFLIEGLEKKQGDSNPYYEATIRWVSQPDGTTHFSE